MSTARPALRQGAPELRTRGPLAQPHCGGGGGGPHVPRTHFSQYTYSISLPRTASCRAPLAPGARADAPRPLSPSPRARPALPARRSRAMARGSRHNSGRFPRDPPGGSEASGFPKPTAPTAGSVPHLVYPAANAEPRKSRSVPDWRPCIHPLRAPGPPGGRGWLARCCARDHALP